MDENEFKDKCTRLNDIRDIVHDIARSKGWWDDERNDGELIALMHSELSEALEELRKPSVNIGALAEELADVIIRILDYCGKNNIDIGIAFFKKIIVNRNRPHKHSGKRF